MGKRFLVAFLVFISTVFFANLAVSLFGVVPVGFGFTAPAGVLFAGVAFSARDWLDDVGGRKLVVLAILIGAILSVMVSGALALASGSAFLLSELLDFVVYAPLRSRSKILAVILSNTVGAVADSAVFLYLADFSLSFLPGQVIGKTYITLLSVVLILIIRYQRMSK